MRREFPASLIIILLMVFSIGDIHARNTIFTDETEDRLPLIVDASCDADFVDIDRDGDLDILVSNNYTATLIRSLLLLNDGTGCFYRDSTHMLPNFYGVSTRSSLGDIDRDDDLDIYVAMDVFDDFLFVNDGSGYFTDESNDRLPGFVGGWSNEEPIFIDVDGDLDLDFIVANSRGEYNWLCLNDGLGFFTSHRNQFPSGNDNSYQVITADVDADFDADAFVANTWDPDKLMINDGHGLFGDMTDIQIEEDDRDTYGCAFGDVDADGAFDVVLATMDDPANRIFINRGDGHFDERTEDLLPWSRDYGFQVSLGDVDNDGDLDILSANYNLDRETDALLINDGTGRFTNQTSSYLPGGEAFTSILTLGDVDGDGDLDIFECNYGTQNRLFINDGTPDAHPPVIPNTFHHPDTKNTRSPYLITTTVWDNISVAVGEIQVSLEYQVRDDRSPGLSNEGIFKVRMLDCGGYLYRGLIPAQPDGSVVYYRIRAEDRMGNVAYDPPGAPKAAYRFRVDSTEGMHGNLD